jgi:hypothetical protein
MLDLIKPFIIRDSKSQKLDKKKRCNNNNGKKKNKFNTKLNKKKKLKNLSIF